jgi:hypothetical protein
MLNNGITPTIYHFTELAGFYANRGEVQKTMFVLSRMEEQFEKNAADGKSGETMTTPEGDELDVDAADIILHNVDEAVMDQMEAVSEGVISRGQLSSPAPAKQPNEARQTGHGPPPVPEFSELSIPEDEQPSPALTFDLPPPGLVMYVSIMRGFLSSRNFDALEEVHRRFQQRYAYVPGDNSYLDDLYADWNTMLDRGQVSPGSSFNPTFLYTSCQIQPSTAPG